MIAWNGTVMTRLLTTRGFVIGNQSERQFRVRIMETSFSILFQQRLLKSSLRPRPFRNGSHRVASR